MRIRHHLACQELSLLEDWSVHTRNGSLFPSSQWRHSSRASLTARIANIVVSLGQGQTSGEEDTGMKLLVTSHPLGENSFYPHVRSVQHKLSLSVRYLEDGS